MFRADAGVRMSMADRAPTFQTTFQSTEAPNVQSGSSRCDPQAIQDILNKGAHDVIIVGAGPAGCFTAIHLLQRGITPMIIERESIPRYHIGESLTGECGNCLRAIGLEPLLRERRYPVKHGVTVFGANGRGQFWVPVMKRGEDGQLHEASTWQVPRAEFDATLLEHAIERGALYLQASVQDVLYERESASGEAVSQGAARVVGIRIELAGATYELSSQVIVDASGQNTFLASRGVIGPKDRGNYDKQLAVFTQVRGAIRDPGDASGNTLIFYQKRHHWSWFIPLNDDVTSIGVVVPGDYFRDRNLSREDFLKAELKTLNPELSWRVENVEFVEPCRTASNYSYRIDHYVGNGFICVGDSHQFVDPIFSFGVFLGIKEGALAAEAIEAYLSLPSKERLKAFEAYEKVASLGQGIIQDMIDCFWRYPLAFQRLSRSTHKDEVIDIFARRIYGKERAFSAEVQAIFRDLAGHFYQSPCINKRPLI